MSQQTHVSQYLSRIRAGDSNAVGELLPLVYDELRALAGSYFQNERPNHTLQPTALVHEAFLKLVQQPDAHYHDRAHFFAVAAQAIRRLLVDHARKRAAAKRNPGSWMTCTLDAEFVELDVLALEEALQRLHALHERQARIVELRFFAGLEIDEVAELLEVHPNTVKGDWRMARAWLRLQLET